MITRILLMTLLLALLWLGWWVTCAIDEGRGR